MNLNIENERTKRKHVYWLQHAKRFSESTIQAIERAIAEWERYTHGRDFRRITPKQAGQFSEWLSDSSSTGRQLSAATRYQMVRLVRSFYLWLAAQPGRNSKLILNALSYLTVNRETVAEATSPGKRKIPTLSYVRRLVDSIVVANEVDLRDRAIIAFMLCSGARAGAAASLSLGCFDEDSLIVDQDPKHGVKTKNRSRILTRLIVPDKILVEHIRAWVHHLKEDRLFGSQDPLFPRTRVRQNSERRFEATDVAPIFWSSGVRIDQILKRRAAAARLEPIDCHALRHAHTQIAFSRAKSGEELKAISQNLGHRHFATTASVYAHLEESKQCELIGALPFDTATVPKLDPEKAAALRELLREMGLTVS